MVDFLLNKISVSFIWEKCITSNSSLNKACLKVNIRHYRFLGFGYYWYMTNFKKRLFERILMYWYYKY